VNQLRRFACCTNLQLLCQLDHHQTCLSGTCSHLHRVNNVYKPRCCNQCALLQLHHCLHDMSTHRQSIDGDSAECYLCNENVYDIPSQLCQLLSGHGWFHTDCMKITFDTCTVCGKEVRYKPFGERLAFKLPNGDFVHKACNVKPIAPVPIESTDPQGKQLLDDVQSITQHYNAQPPLPEASSGIMVVWCGPPDKCCKGICQICKVMIYQSQQRF